MIPLDLAALLLFAWALTRLHRWNEIHHGFYGILGVVFGLMLGWHWLQVIGGVLLIDDAIQHAIQVRWPGSRYSLLFWLYALTVARWGWVRRLNEWLDKETA